jgi:hypothetical protein
VKIKSLTKWKAEFTEVKHEDIEVHRRTEWWRRHPSKFGKDSSKATQALVGVCQGVGWEEAVEPE